MSTITPKAFYKNENELFKEETKNFLLIVSSWMTILLYLAFWVCDLFFAPELKWEFLAYRLTTVGILVGIHHFAKKIQTYEGSLQCTVLVGFVVAFFISLMTYRTGGPYSDYYVGLMLVTVGGLGFIHWKTSYYPAILTAIFLPYVILSALSAEKYQDWRQLVINCFFLFSIGVIAIVISQFNKRIRRSEFTAQRKLKHELTSRNQIIDDKTKEAVRLSNLSTQFSPQVVDAIRCQKLDLSKVHRRRICAIFIDIVGSTERVIRLDQEKIDRVLEQFMEDSVNVLLKYDLTIDKFQGDGILAFSNDPVKHDDFIIRACMAALEIRETIKSNQSFYERFWKKELQISIGIATGYANVGFYGNRKFFKTYTAIGAPLPMAARLSDKAEPGQILVESDVAEELEKSGFVLKFIGNCELKGFEQDVNHVYELVSSTDEEILDQGTQTCPTCVDSVLYLHTTPEGFFTFKCRKCDYTPGSEAENETQLSAA